MVKSTAQKIVCEGCGADVRQGSAFCYNCGESIDLAPPPPAIIKPDPELLNGNLPSTEPMQAFRDPEPPPVLVPSGSPDRPPMPAAKTEVFPRAAMETPRRPRTRVRKLPEVEYIERSSLSGAFIIAAVVLTVIATLLVAAALYLQ